jgi:hypothetical protein
MSRPHEPSKDQIKAGDMIVDRVLFAGIPLIAAAWVWIDENKELRFVISTPIADDGPYDAFMLIRPMMADAEDSWVKRVPFPITSWNLCVVGQKDTLGAAATLSGEHRARCRYGRVLVQPLHTDEDHKLALAEIRRLMDASPGQADPDRLDVLSSLVDVYERQHHPIAIPTADAAVRFRAEQEGRVTSIDYAARATELVQLAPVENHPDIVLLDVFGRDVALDVSWRHAERLVAHLRERLAGELAAAFERGKRANSGDPKGVQVRARERGDA